MPAFRPGSAYRVTYRRAGWAPGKFKSVALLSERGALGFASKLSKTKGVSEVEYVEIEVMAGLWVYAYGDQGRKHKPARTKKGSQ